MKVITNNIPETILSQLSDYISARIGMSFTKNRLKDLERGIRSAAKSFGFDDVQSCIQWILSSQLTSNQIEVLANHLTVGETYFFREKGSLEIFEKHILQELINSRKDTERHLRTWSAACSTGEEPYSIAIILNKIVPNLKDWNITILATDINADRLKKASEGHYGKWSFRDSSPEVIGRYFKETKKDHYRVLPVYRNMVRFSSLNLVEDVYPSTTNNTNAMDVIFCRNVLMYFSHDTMKKVIKKLYNSLVNGGYLIVSHTEASHVLFKDFVTVRYDGAIVYKKDINKSQSIEDFTTKDNLNFSFINDTNIETDTPTISTIVPGPISFLPQTNQEVNIEVVEKEIDNTDFNPPDISERDTPVEDTYLEIFKLYEQGRYTEVEKKIFDLASNGLKDPRYYTLLARTCANQGKLKDALKWCEDAIAIDKLNTSCHYLYASIHEEKGQNTEAIESLKRVLYLDHDFVMAHFALGNLTRRNNNYKESYKYYENALRLLSTYNKDDILPESENINAGRLKEIIYSMM